MQMTRTQPVATVASSDLEELTSITKEELLNIAGCLRVNRLSPSPSRNECIVIDHATKLSELGTIPSLELNECEVEQMSKESPLDFVDEDLSWKDQYKSLPGKLAGVCYTLGSYMI